MPPPSKAVAEEFFMSAVRDVEERKRILLAAFCDSALVGTVQIVTATPLNQPHRADIAKLLVAREARGKGVATRWMEQVEVAVKRVGKSLLVLDTAVGGSADRLYGRLGWTRVGQIPRYALFPDGTWCDTAIYWKQIS